MRWARPWILCIVFYYPALWLAISCVWALPGLIRNVFFGAHIVLLRITPLGLMVWSAPADRAVHPIAARLFFASLPSAWMLIPVAVAIALGFTAGGQTRRILSGLAISVLADAAVMMLFTGRWRIRQVDTPVILSSIIFFAGLCLGLWLLSAGWVNSNYWNRLVGLWASVAVPSLMVWLILRHYGGFAFRHFLWMLPLPPAAGALVASLFKPKLFNADPKPVEARAVLSGLVATFLLAAAIAWGGPSITQTFQEHQQRVDQAAVAKLPPIQVNAPYAKIFFQKGVSLSAEFPDPYASPGARGMLRSLRKDGVNAVALVPYGGMQLGSPEVHDFGRHSWESDEGLRELSRLAHAIGMKVMLKPGIWIRGGHFGGDIQFSSPANREKWFDEYGKFIERYAKVAEEIHADLFCVGGEFVRMSPYASEWRRIIADVRRIYPGPLTYAANFGDEFQDLQFWDALDYIGLQEYYPLPDNLSTAALVARVEAVQKRYHKPVIFTEAGFSSAPGANRRPWQDGTSGKVDLQLQARCYQAIFRAFYNEPWFEGMYWWKIGTNGFGGPEDLSLTPWDKPAMVVVREWYESGVRRNTDSGNAKIKPAAAAP